MSKQKEGIANKNTFSDENIKRLQDTTRRIQHIFEICDEFGKISLALAESKKAQSAIIMHFIVCKENFEKSFLMVKISPRFSIKRICVA